MPNIDIPTEGIIPTFAYDYYNSNTDGKDYFAVINVVANYTMQHGDNRQVTTEVWRSTEAYYSESDAVCAAVDTLSGMLSKALWYFQDLGDTG